MAIDFPNSPTNGQVFTVGEVTWVYDGSKWNLNSTTTAFAPIGTIVAYGGQVPPNGWLFANGTSLSRSTYSDLFNIIGTSFGEGSVPGTTFALPNFFASEGSFIIRTIDAEPIIVSESRIGVPVGTLQLFAAAPIGGGWLRANGSAISRTSYADLFTVIGTTYGSGDGSTTFNLPNLPDSGAGSPAYYIKAVFSGDVEPSTVTHATSHIRGGSDVIDADRAQVDYVPTYYTRNSSAPEAGAVTDLTAHLSGINTGFYNIGLFYETTSTTQVDGSFGGNIIYTQATLTLTPGTYIVEAGLSIRNLTTTDACATGIYNLTTSTEVSGSRGLMGVSLNGDPPALCTSRRRLIVVSSTTNFCPLGTRNGASTIRIIGGGFSGGLSGYINAVRVK